MTDRLTHPPTPPTQGPIRYRFSCMIGGVNLGKTHHGFCAYYRSLVMLGLARDVAKLWEERGEGEYTVLVTGHSLGKSLPPTHPPTHLSIYSYFTFSIPIALFTHPSS